MAKSIKQLNDHDLLTAAFTAAQTNQADLAIKHFKEALRRDPEDSFACLEIAKCHHQLDRPAEAKFWLEKMMPHTEQDADLLLPLAAAQQLTRDYPAAIRTMQRAEHVPRLRGVALVRQAELHELSNHLPEARSALDQLQLTDKTKTPAHRAIEAKLNRREGNLQQAKNDLQSLIAELQTDPDSDKNFIASLEYELAQVHDRLGEYEDSHTCLVSAKSHNAGTDAFHIAQRGRKGVIHTLSGLCREIDNETYRGWGSGSRVEQGTEFSHAFLLGHPRSGTTLIEQALDAHPELISADETSMFHNAVWMPTVLQQAAGGSENYSQFLNEASPNYIRRLKKDYRVRWKRMIKGKADGVKVLLDKNPALTTRLAVISRFFPEAPIVFALRDPRDVVISSFMQPVGMNDWSVNWLTLQETVDYYCFAMQMWLDIRGKIPNPWIEIRYEDCVQDFGKEAERCTQHLGLKWQAEQLNFRTNLSQKAVFSPTYGDVAKPMYTSSMGRWKNYREQLSPYIDQLAPFVEAFGYEKNLLD